MSRGSKYNARITVQQSKPANQTKGETGGLTNVWTTLFTCWAKVVPASRSKRLLYGEVVYNEFYEVEMRGRETNIDADCRIVYRGNAFQILSFTIGDVVNVDMIR